MNRSLPSSERFSHSPELADNMILASLRLFFWLVFHPSAWHNHVNRIDSDLRPDFSLADLNREHWRNPILQRLVMMAFIIWPLLVGIVIGLVLWLADAPRNLLAYSVVMGIAASFASNLTISISLNVAGGISAGVIGGVTGGLASYLVFAAMPDSAIDIARGVSLGMTAGITAAVAASTVSRGRAHYNIFKQLGGVVVGVVISGGAIGLAAGTVLSVFQIDLGTEAGFALSSLGNGLIGLAASIILGVGYGMAIVLRTHKWHAIIHGVIFSAILGISFGLSVGPTPNFIKGFAMGVSEGMIFSALFALPYILAETIAGPWAGAVAGALGSYGVYIAFLVIVGDFETWNILLFSLISLWAGTTLAWWRPAVLYPVLAAWNTFLYYADKRRTASQVSLLPWHSAFWDQHQRLPLYGLENYLVMITERNPAEGQAAIKYLENSFQRWASQAALIELETRWARWLVAVPDIEAISTAHLRLESRELEGPTSSLLRTFDHYSQDVKAALNQTTPHNQRLALRDVEIRVNRLLRELEQRKDEYAAHFYPVATHWYQIISNHIQSLTKTVEISQEIDNPYIFGVPLTEQQDLFVGRTDISTYIEQLLLDRRRPPLLLFGQRRMGKTSLLHNLSRLLPSTIVLMYVDGQGIAGASDYGDFLYNLTRQMTSSAKRHQNLTLPQIRREALKESPFTAFDEWLDNMEQKLHLDGRDMALLALDEFEAVDNVLDKGRFDEEDLLNMFRHLNQHRPGVKVLLAGSHTLEEFQRWASFLINMQVIHIGYLNESEARQLIEQPVKDFVLRYEPEASQRVLALTRGHPYLIQLLCYEIVILKNEQTPADRRLVRIDDVAAAVPRALSHGAFFFADIERNQVSKNGLSILRFLASMGEGVVVSPELLSQTFPGNLDITLAQLLRRELIEVENGGYRFQVELIRHWFAQSS